MEEVKELAIGEEGVIDGVKVRCVEADQSPGVWVCPGCVFDLKCRANAKILNFKCCPSGGRTDGKYVIFQEVK